MSTLQKPVKPSFCAAAGRGGNPHPFVKCHSRLVYKASFIRLVSIHKWPFGFFAIIDMLPKIGFWTLMAFDVIINISSW